MRFIIYKALYELDSHIETLGPCYDRFKLKMKRIRIIQWVERKYGLNLRNVSFRYMIRVNESDRFPRFDFRDSSES